MSVMWLLANNHYKQNAYPYLSDYNFIINEINNRSLKYFYKLVS